MPILAERVDTFHDGEPWHIKHSYEMDHLQFKFRGGYTNQLTRVAKMRFPLSQNWMPWCLDRAECSYTGNGGSLIYSSNGRCKNDIKRTYMSFRVEAIQGALSTVSVFPGKHFSMSFISPESRVLWRSMRGSMIALPNDVSFELYWSRWHPFLQRIGPPSLFRNLTTWLTSIHICSPAYSDFLWYLSRHSKLWQSATVNLGEEVHNNDKVLRTKGH